MLMELIMLISGSVGLVTESC